MSKLKHKKFAKIWPTDGNQNGVAVLEQRVVKPRAIPAGVAPTQINHSDLSSPFKPFVKTRLPTTIETIMGSEATHLGHQTTGRLKLAPDSLLRSNSPSSREETSLSPSPPRCLPPLALAAAAAAARACAANKLTSLSDIEVTKIADPATLRSDWSSPLSHSLPISCTNGSILTAGALPPFPHPTCHQGLYNFQPNPTIFDDHARQRRFEFISSARRPMHHSGSSSETSGRSTDSPSIEKTNGEYRYLDTEPRKRRYILLNFLFICQQGKQQE